MAMIVPCDGITCVTFDGDVMVSRGFASYVGEALIFEGGS